MDAPAGLIRNPGSSQHHLQEKNAMWSSYLIDLTRPMTKQTGIELAGKMMAVPNPYGEVQVTYLRDWSADNNSRSAAISVRILTDAPVHVVSLDATGPHAL
jgi:hypothetical protein